MYRGKYLVFYCISTLKYSDKTNKYFRGKLYERFME